jgi:FMN phosphatase YigB (HAD superfamily)
LSREPLEGDKIDFYGTEASSEKFVKRSRKVSLKPLRIRWLGVDYGQCLMSPAGLRNELNFGSIMKDLGRPHEIAEKIHRYRRLKEKYGSIGAIKEGHRDEILNYVFDGDEEATAVFEKYEHELLSLGRGVADTLPWLREQGIELDIVAEGKKTLGPITSVDVIKFLKNKGLTQYFSFAIMPIGKTDLADFSVDLSTEGKTKQSGALWDYIVENLTKRGFKIDECAVIGDKLATDIEPSRKRGFHTIQFAGYVDYGDSADAEYKVFSWSELKDFVVGAKE